MSFTAKSMSARRAWIALDHEARPPRLYWRGAGDGWQSATPDMLSAESRQQFERGLRCGVLLPASACMLRRLMPPNVGARRLRRMLPGLLDVELPFPVEECEVRFDIRHAPDATPLILAIAARRADIAGTLEACHHLGCEPLRVLPEPWVLWLGLRRETAEDPLAVLAMCHLLDDRQTVVVGQGARLLACASGVRDDISLTARVLENAGHAAPERLIMRLAGDVRDMDCDASAFGLRAADGTDIRVVAEPESWRWRAMADALSDATAEVMDFRPSDRPHPDSIQRLRRAPWHIAVMLLSASLLLSAAHTTALLRVERQAEALRTAWRAELDQLAGYRITRPDTEATAAAQAALMDRLLPDVGDWTKSTTAEIFGKVLEAAAFDDIRLHAFSLRDGVWTLRGSTPQADAVEAFRARLQLDGLSFEARIDGTDALGRIAFTMNRERT